MTSLTDLPTAPLPRVRPLPPHPSTEPAIELDALRAELDRATHLAATMVEACDRLATRIALAKIALDEARA